MTNKTMLFIIKKENEMYNNFEKAQELILQYNSNVKKLKGKAEQILTDKFFDDFEKLVGTSYYETYYEPITNVTTRYLHSQDANIKIEA